MYATIRLENITENKLETWRCTLCVGGQWNSIWCFEVSNHEVFFSQRTCRFLWLETYSTFI